MWHSDKPIIQHELAERLASMMHALPDDHGQLLYAKGMRIGICHAFPCQAMTSTNRSVLLDYEATVVQYSVSPIGQVREQPALYSRTHSHSRVFFVFYVRGTVCCCLPVTHSPQVLCSHSPYAGELLCVFAAARLGPRKL